MGSMDKMHMAMASIDPSGDNDVDFVRLMLPHQQAAIDMAEAELLGVRSAVASARGYTFCRLLAN
jgi:uncharacterized protein (DUF305 family)